MDEGQTSSPKIPIHIKLHFEKQIFRIFKCYFSTASTPSGSPSLIVYNNYQDRLLQLVS